MSRSMSHYSSLSASAQKREQTRCASGENTPEYCQRMGFGHGMGSEQPEERVHRRRSHYTHSEMQLSPSAQLREQTRCANKENSREYCQRRGFQFGGAQLSQLSQAQPSRRGSWTQHSRVSRISGHSHRSPYRHFGDDDDDDAQAAESVHDFYDLQTQNTPYRHFGGDDPEDEPESHHAHHSQYESAIQKRERTRCLSGENSQQYCQRLGYPYQASERGTEERQELSQLAHERRRNRLGQFESGSLEGRPEVGRRWRF